MNAPTGTSAKDEPSPDKAEAVAAAGGSAIAEIDKKLKQKELDHATVDLRLKRIVGYGGIALLVVQLYFANRAFWIYGDRNKWDIPPAAISAWLGAAVVQVAIITRAITKYIFSESGKPGGAGGG